MGEPYTGGAALAVNVVRHPRWRTGSCSLYRRGREETEVSKTIAIPMAGLSYFYAVH